MRQPKPPRTGRFSFQSLHLQKKKKKKKCSLQQAPQATRKREGKNPPIQRKRRVNVLVGLEGKNQTFKSNQINQCRNDSSTAMGGGVVHHVGSSICRKW